MKTPIACLRFNATAWNLFGDCLDWPDWMLSTLFVVGVR